MDECVFPVPPLCTSSPLVNLPIDALAVADPPSYSPFTSSSRPRARTRAGGLRGFDPGAFQLLVISADLAEYGMPGVSRVKHHRDKAAAAE